MCRIIAYDSSCRDLSIPMPSEAHLISLFQTILMYLYRIGGVVLVCVGTVSCALNLAASCRKTFRRNPCSMYFIVENVTNLLLIYTLILPLVLSNGHNIDVNAHSIYLCRLEIYFSFEWDILVPFYLILAAAGRVQSLREMLSLVDTVVTALHTYPSSVAKYSGYYFIFTHYFSLAWLRLHQIILSAIVVLKLT